MISKSDSKLLGIVFLETLEFISSISKSKDVASE